MVEMISPFVRRFGTKEEALGYDAILVKAAFADKLQDIPENFIWEIARRSTVTAMPEDSPKFTIAEHLDPDREISRNADPLVEHTSYLFDVKSAT